MATRLTEQVKPSVLHAASNYANATIALAIGKSHGLPVVYEVRGFWEDTWLSRHPNSEKMAASELYQLNRDLETRCMLAADLVVTLGEAMREEIVARGVPADQVLIVPNAVSDDFLQPLPDAQKLRGQLGIKPDEHVIGEVSSLVPHEGIGTLLAGHPAAQRPRPAGASADRRRRAGTGRLAAPGGGPRPGRGGHLHRSRACDEST